MIKPEGMELVPETKDEGVPAMADVKAMDQATDHVQKEVARCFKERFDLQLMPQLLECVACVRTLDGFTFEYNGETFARARKLGDDKGVAFETIRSG